MAVLTMNFESEYLKGNNTVSVILPNKQPNVTPEAFYSSGEKYKVLWLLHGTFGDHSDWLRKTNIELYACEKNWIVVMPGALNSNYSNWGSFMMRYDMYDYLIYELMPLVYHWLPASDRREDNYIAGLSMGGRGAIKYAVNFPEKFCAAAILSAAPINFSDVTSDYLNSDNAQARRLKEMADNAGGWDRFIASEENVWAVINKLVASSTLPRLFFACGTEDDIAYENMLKFQRHAKEIGLDAIFWIKEKYEHEWRFWDLAIQQAFAFFLVESVY